MKLAAGAEQRGGNASRPATPDKAGEEIAAIFREAGHEVALQMQAGAATIDSDREDRGGENPSTRSSSAGATERSAAAAAAAKNGMPLGILPLGTMNFFAHSLAIPMDMKEAAAALAGGEVRAVDIATVNGRAFVHTLSLGLHPTMVKEREKLSFNSRYGKMLGSVRAFLRVVRNAKRFSVTVVTDNRTVTARASGMVVSNNPLGEGHMPWADRVDLGTLGVYLSSARGWSEIARILFAAALGRIREEPLIEFVRTATTTIHVRRPHHIDATLDGEVVRLKGPLKVEILPGGLKVLAPRAA